MSERYASAYLFAALYAANDGGDRQLSRAVLIEGRPADSARLVIVQPQRGMTRK